MSHLRFLSHLAAGAAFLVAGLQAQTSSVAPRIVGPVDEQSLITLKGNVSPLARAEFDRGAASPSAELHYVRLVLSRSAAQQAALDKFMAEQLDRNSPNYHHWLNPDEFGRLYGPADSDIAAITSWLQSRGLTVESTSSGRTSIAFSGTVSQLENAFHTRIHTFQRGGEQYFANTTNPKIPSALASVVFGVAQLCTYAPRPHLVKGQPGMFDPRSGHFAAPESRVVRPNYTTPGSPPFLWITPADAATIYNTPNAWNAGFSSGTSYTGTGVVIGIGGVSAINPSTVVNYRKRFLNGNTTAPTITNIGGHAVIGGATDEAYIDNELSGGIAPGATIHFYTADDSDGGLFAVIDRVTADNSVDIFSLSFGLCEYFWTTAQNKMISDDAEQMTAQGIAVTVSSGDSGSAGCDSSAATAADMGLQVNGLASTPFNIAVGGTDTFGLLDHFSTYANNNQSSSDFYRSALSYIPEAAWNDSPDTNGLLADNVPSLIINNAPNIVAGGGGVSACSTNNDTDPNVCFSGYAKPSWQRGPGVPNDNARDLPDVSLMAGNGVDNAIWLVCIDDPDYQGGPPDDCSDQGGGSFHFTGYGGTSTSAPAFAGMLALVQESLGGHGHRLGLDAAKTLYDLFNSSHASDVFHDVTQGNISVYCDTATPNCARNAAGYDFLTGYDTGTGYDLATGIGSINATNLVKFWSHATGSAQATINLTQSATQITTAESLVVDAQVIGGSGTPTGTATLSGGGYTSAVTVLGSNGTAPFSIAPGVLALGTDTLTLAYSGDATYASTSNTTTVTVTKATPTVTVTPASASIAADQTLKVTINVTSAGGTPTGTVTLSGGGYTSAATALSGGAVSITIPSNSLAVGTDTLYASYSGDAKYVTASGLAYVTVTAVVKTTPAVTVTPANTSIAANSPLNVTVSVTGTGSTPTGTITLSGGGYTSAATSLPNGSGTVSITIPANSLAVGTVTLTASYSGDTKYTTASGSASVTVTPVLATPTVTVTPATTSIAVNSSLNVTVSVTGTGATPTGNVKLSTGGYTSASTALPNGGGSVTITIPANTLAVGPNTLTASYSGDANYTTASGSASVTGTVVPIAPTITVTPASATIDATQPLDVTVKVTGAAGTPTGHVTLAATGYTSAATSLSSGGSATITIPANTFKASGAVTLTANYTGDTFYTTGTATGTVTINAPYTLTATNPSAVSAGSSATSTITVKSDGAYAGTVAMTCSLTSSPSGATHLPTCSVTAGGSLTFDTTHTTGTTTVTLNTTGPTMNSKSASLDRRGLPRWTGAGGAVLAVLLFIGMPARRRSWRNLLGLLILIAAFGTLSACGGSGSSSVPGTTAGQYTFTVTGTGTPAITPTPTATVTLTVN